MTDLAVLRTVELKGRVRGEDLVPPLGLDLDEAARRLADLAERGLVTPAGRAHRLSEEGRTHLAALLEADRAPVDGVVLEQAYDEFCAFNTELKTVITAWQLRADGGPNDHTDAEYDAGVLARLADLHARVLPLMERLGTIASRLAPYAARLQRAQDNIAAGDPTWVARPIMDSYHTVWFELHEDLIQLCGRTRADEAAEGRAL